MNRLTATLLLSTLVVSAFSFDKTGKTYDSVAAPGDLDVTFSDDGKVTDTFPGGSADGYAVAVQPDAKIVIAGSRTVGLQKDFGIMRFNEDGSPDTSFGTAGRVVTSIGAGSSEAKAVALQADGKIVVAGVSATGFAVVRYNTDGSLDTSFGKKGLVEMSGVIGTSMALTIEGKIVVAGYEEEGTDDDFVVVRYNQDGSLDTTFDSDGVVTTPVSPDDDRAFAVAVYSDGKIVATGLGRTTPYIDFAVVRYNSDGSLDTSFDKDGKVLTRIRPSFLTSIGRAIAIHPNGKIVVAGVTSFASTNNFSLIQYNADGSPDTSFGSNGAVVINTTLATVNGLSIEADGRIVAAGTWLRATGDWFVLVRFETNGSRDRSFGPNCGLRFIGFGEFPGDSARGIAIDSQGRIVVGGKSSGRFALARLLGGSPGPIRNVSLSGRVVRANGRGLARARVTLRDPCGQSRTAVTNDFGYYRFLFDLPTNADYNVSVSAKRYSFATPSRVVNVQGDLSNVDFVSIE